MQSDSAEDSGADGRTSPPFRPLESDDFTVRRYEPDDETAVLGLLRVALGESETRRRSPAAWRWKHFENPFGPSLLLVCCTPGGEVVALRAFMRWGLTVAGEDLEAVQAVDTAVAPQYRRMGLFSRMTERACAEVRDEAALVFNTPNQYARPGYLRLGWQDLGSLPLMALAPTPVKSACDVLRQAIRSSNSRPGPSRIAEGDLTIQGLLERRDLGTLIAKHCRKVGLQDGVQTRQSVQYLRWRYLQHPYVRYRAVWIEGRSSELSACLVYREGTRLGANEVLISEIFLSRDDHGLAVELLDVFLRHVEADYILASFPRHRVLNAVLRSVGFRSLPPIALEFLFERLLPGRQKPRRLLVRPLGSGLAADVLRLDDWHLTVGDLELF